MIIHFQLIEPSPNNTSKKDDFHLAKSFFALI